ncbi:hypothetical protein SDC9_209040 [bioreactor metagenome]|uniref:Uncharacterized protein n=1 Tax=bioreactor metagenome TaxID=1076179 RepID=A0A645JC62_9ZZZZ
MAFIQYPQLARNRHGGHLVVARYHHRLNTRLAAHLNRLSCFGARRINHTRQPHKDKLCFQPVASKRHNSHRFVSRGQHAQRLSRKMFVGGQQTAPVFVVQRFHLAIDQHAVTPCNQLIGCALHQQLKGVLSVHRAHQLALRIERNLINARPEAYIGARR